MISAVSIIREFFRYVVGVIQPKARTVDVTIVRRYPSPTGYVGELYVDGKHIGVTCDRFEGCKELFRFSLEIGYESGRRVLRNDIYVITSGDFTSQVSYNTCLVGSLEPMENSQILKRLVDAVSGARYIRLNVLNRPLIEI